MNPTLDLQQIMAGGLGESVTLWTGAQVLGVPGVASTEDQLTGGDSVVAGMTRSLRFASADVPGIQPGKALTWGGKAWIVTRLGLRANGHLTVAFLGAA